MINPFGNPTEKILVENPFWKIPLDKSLVPLENIFGKPLEKSLGKIPMKSWKYPRENISEKFLRKIPG